MPHHHFAVTPSSSLNTINLLDDRVTLTVQLLLSSPLHRLDLARQVYHSAKVWAEDAVWLQIVEAWIGLRAVSAPFHSSRRPPSELNAHF